SSSPRRNPHPISMARIAYCPGGNRDPAPARSRLPCSAVSQFPTWTPNPANSSDASDPGRELRTEQPGIGSLTHGSQAQVDCGRCVLLLFEMDSVSQDNSAIEC